jgi:hypothetical protein
MKHVTVSTVRTVSIDLTGEDWDLYTSVTPQDVIEAAVQDINATIASNFNVGRDRTTVARAGFAALSKYRALGATDSEPIAVLEELMENLFPDEDW